MRHAIKPWTANVGLVLLIVSGFLGGSWACQGKPQALAVGLLATPGSIPVYVAQNKGLFAKNGLDVTIKQYDSGQSAIKGMLSSEVDMAGTTDGGVIGSALSGSQFKILATIDKHQGFYLIARNDRGIQEIQDLKGKKVGVTMGGIGQFYLGRFLDLHGLSIQDVTLVNVSATSMPDAISAGKIDAAVQGQPSRNQIATQLGSNAMVWPIQSGQPAYTIVIARSDWIAGNPKVVNKFLKALATAEDYILTHPAEAQNSVVKMMNLDQQSVASDWKEHEFSLSLDQSLISAVEDEARWTIADNLSTQKDVPDFLSYIYVDGLKTVDQRAVNIYIQ